MRSAASACLPAAREPQPAAGQIGVDVHGFLGVGPCEFGQAPRWISSVKRLECSTSLSMAKKATIGKSMREVTLGIVLRLKSQDGGGLLQIKDPAVVVADDIRQ